MDVSKSTLNDLEIFLSHTMSHFKDDCTKSTYRHIDVCAVKKFTVDILIFVLLRDYFIIHKSLSVSVA